MHTYPSEQDEPKELFFLKDQKKTEVYDSSAVKEQYFSRNAKARQIYSCWKMKKTHHPLP